MSCTCGDPFCYGDNCNNNAGGGLAIIFAILLYPYLPFMIVGYEWMDTLSKGVNLFKWFGAIVGFGVGFVFYFKFFRKIVEETLHLQSSILYWVICYGLASFMFIILKPIYPENKILIFILNLWSGFFKWALTAS